MLHPRPALADGVENGLSTGSVGNVGGRQIDHQQAPVGVDRNVALAPDDLLARIITPCVSMRSLDRLAVDHAGRRARLAPGPLTVRAVSPDPLF